MPLRTFSEARKALEAEETSCEKLVSSFLERIDERNDDLNALLSVDEEGALNHARYLDSQLKRGNKRELAGLILAVKDNICIRGQQATCGSRMLESFKPNYDATAIARLREKGAIFIGKANCDEFGMGSSNETSHFGAVSHPDAADRVPGGSSGGSAAAVKAGFCHAALGSDTGGSVRQPAAFCGISGLRPTYGRVSRYGLVAYASSLDTIGPMARSAEDLAIILKAISGSDENDASAADVPVPDYSAGLKDDLKGLKVGLPAEYFDSDKASQAVLDAVDGIRQELEQEGASVQEVSLPHAEYALSTYYLLAAAEASSNLARYDGVRFGHRAAPSTKTQNGTLAENGTLEELYTRSRTEGFGEEAKRRIMLGTYALSAGYHEKYYGKAQKVRSLIRHDFLDVFEDVDVLLTPTTPTAAFEKGSQDSPLAMYQQDLFTVAPSLAGLPAVSIPAGEAPDSNLPLGAQLIGRHFDEALLLQVARSASKLAKA